MSRQLSDEVESAIQESAYRDCVAVIRVDTVEEYDAIAAELRSVCSGAGDAGDRMEYWHDDGPAASMDWCVCLQRPPRLRPPIEKDSTMSKKAYRIVSDAGAEMGVYEGDSPADALDAMARDAGYESQADVVANGIAPFTGFVTEVDVDDDSR